MAAETGTQRLLQVPFVPNMIYLAGNISLMTALSQQPST